MNPEQDKRLRGVETAVQVMGQQFSDHTVVVEKLVTKHNETLYGNGKLGLTVRVDREEQNTKRHFKFIWVLISAVIGLVVKLAYESLHHIF